MAKKTEGFATQSVEIEELTEKQLKFGYWYLTHKKKILKGVNMSLIVFSAITFGYALIATGIYYIFQHEELQISLATSTFDYVNVLGVHQSNAILPLQITTRQVVNAGDGKIDIAIKVQNPNTKWALENVSFQVSHGGKFYDSQETFVLPGEAKYLFLLNVEGARSGTPQVFFENYHWRRVIQYQEWGPPRLNFLVTNKKFVSARQGEISDELPISEVQADITNSTPYNYNDLEIQIALFSGSRMVGVSSVTMQDVASGDLRTIVSRWPQSLPSVSNVEIIPTVNILDQSVYKDFEGEFDPSHLDIDVDDL